MKHYSVLFLILLASACKKPAPAAHESSATAAKPTFYVSAQGGLRMRAEPTASGPLVILIPDNAAVEWIQAQSKTETISGKTGSWTQVGYAGKVGWVFGGFLSTERKVSPDENPITARIAELTGIKLPPLREVRSHVNSGKVCDPAQFRIVKRDSREGFTVWHISPYERECAGYGYSDCFSVIADSDQKYLFSDIDRRSIGEYEDKSKAGSARFSTGLGEGDGCGSSGHGTKTVYFFQTRKAIVQEWSASETCNCPCTAPEGCTCGFTETREEKYLDESGSRIEPSWQKEFF